MIFDAFPELYNQKIILKKLSLKDVIPLETMKKDREVYRYLPTYLPEVLSSDCETFIKKDCERLLAEHSNILLGIYLSYEPDQFIGIAEIYDYVPARQKVSIGCRMCKEYWNQHIATNVVKLLKRYVFEDLKLKEITAHIIIKNMGSIHAAMNNGFTEQLSAVEEDWGFDRPVIVNKYVCYADDYWKCSDIASPK